LRVYHDIRTLGLSQPVLQALALKEYNTPTPIQAQAIPTVLEGRDLLGIAQTGTGKTAAFMLPSIDRLVAADKRPKPRHCRMLVLAPTRELAGQIADSAREYGHFSTSRWSPCSAAPRSTRTARTWRAGSTS
jgi:ATP-dependent RNA helicase RhlE